MKVLVCGGRDYCNNTFIRYALETLHKKSPITLLIHGGARGADQWAGSIAISMGIPTQVFKADWEKFGKAAGSIRNQEMLNSEPDLIMAFPGGRGTADMTRRAEKKGTTVYRPAEDPTLTNPLGL